MTIGFVNLGDLANIRTGKLDANASSDDGEYPFFTCAREPLRISSFSYDCECVLVAGNGDLNAKYYHGKFDAYQRTYIIEARPESQGRLHLRYVYHFLEDYLVTLREQSIGGIIKYIKLGNLTGAKIPLPPLAEQKRIAGILDAADALRAKRRESLAQLDTLIHSIFLDMFGDPVTNPMRWDKRVLETLCHPKQWPTIKKADLTEDGYPVFGANGKIGFYSEYNHAEPTILITCRGATCGTINVCESKSYVTGNAMALNDLDAESVELRFMDHALSTTDFAAVITGVAQPQITRQSLKQLSVPVPPLNLQRRFASIVESAEQQKARMRDHLTELDTLFASLQSRAFKGEL